MPRAAVWLWLGLGCVAAAHSAAAGEKLSFEAHIRPILRTHCFHCHGEAGETQGGLDVRLRRLLAAGGDSGPALVPGKPEESYLLERIRLGEMPPEDVEHRPGEEEIALIERWIAAGAPTAREEPEEIGAEPYFTEEERNFWSFRPVVRPPLPPVSGSDQVRSPIDRFLLARLEAEGLTFSPEADRRTLIRRAYFDLGGLPPTPQDVEAFVNDPAPDAYERLIERLLASPPYGERWGRHWLDAAGYADSEGYTDEDPERPDAWRYRDYVIRAHNTDKPFDQFLCEQLAGDEMLGRAPENLSPDEVEKLTATGLLRMAPDGSGAGGVDRRQASNDTIAATLEIVSTSILGLTVGCAQCHDHRYDPIPQSDYYRFRAIFEPALNWKDWQTPRQRRLSLYTDEDRRRAAEIEDEAKQIEAEREAKQEEYIRQTFEKELAKLAEETRPDVQEAFDTPAEKRTVEQKQLLKEHPSVNVSARSLYLYDKKAADDLKAYADRAAAVRGTKPEEEFVRAVVEPSGASPPQTFLFIRGDYEQPGDELAPGGLTVLTGEEIPVPVDDAELPTTGRRLAYARRLTSGRHPLTARVIVNRVWAHHFGQGLVATQGDFGFLGDGPTHPELLDWLADEFVRSGWSLKNLHRLLMNSTAYRQQSNAEFGMRNAESEDIQNIPQSALRIPHSVDPANSLLWRMNIRRLDAEAVRDSVLAVSGILNSKPGGPPVPVMTDRVGQYVIGIENLNAGRPGPLIPMHGEEFRRSVYVQVRRSRPLTVLETFDHPAMSPNCTGRSTSTVAPQSLMLMNGEFLLDQARHLAQRVRSAAGDDPAEQVRAAWRLVLSREPDEAESAAALEFLSEQEAEFAANPDALKPAAKGAPALDASTAALANFCQALLSCNEFLYVD